MRVNFPTPSKDTHSWGRKDTAQRQKAKTAARRQTAGPPWFTLPLREVPVLPFFSSHPRMTVYAPPARLGFSPTWPDMNTE